MIKLFLDDIRVPSHVWKDTIDPDYCEDASWTIVRSYDAFVSWISQNSLPDLVSFDHDLKYEHYLEENQNQIDYSKIELETGYHAAQWLIKYCQENGFALPQCKVHSMNPEGRNNILRLIELAQ